MPRAPRICSRSSRKGFLISWSAVIAVSRSLQNAVGSNFIMAVRNSRPSCLWLTSEATRSIAPRCCRNVLRASSKLEVRGEIFLMDSSGKKILYTQSVGELRRNVWRPSKNGKIESDWGNNSNHFGHVILRHHWEPQDDGSIHVLIEEYSSEDRVKPGSDATEMKGLLQRKEFVLENFAPVVWKVKNAGEKNVIVRFIPGLREKPETVDVGKLPLANRNVTGAVRRTRKPR